MPDIDKDESSNALPLGEATAATIDSPVIFPGGLALADENGLPLLWPVPASLVATNG